MVKTNLIQKGLIKIDHEDGNKLLSRVHIDDGFFKELRSPWREALVIKLLDKGVRYRTMKYKLSQT